MKKTNAFTLIELLLVMSILGVLAVFALLALNPLESQKKSRDAKRVKDVGTLSSITEQYLADGNSPAAGTCLNSDAGGGSYCSSTGVTGDKQQSCNSNFMVVNLCKYANSTPLDPVNGEQRTIIADDGDYTYESSDTSTAAMGYSTSISGRDYEINTYLESPANFEKIVQDGGNSFSTFEVGTKLTIY